MKINRNFDNLTESYLFAEVARRTGAYSKAHPDKRIIKMGIGDVTLPLAPVVVETMKKAADEMASKATFKGYPEYEGYDFLREAISGYYASFGVDVSPNEIFVNDGDAVFSSRIFPTAEEDRMFIEGDASVHLWELSRAVEESFVV